MIILHSLFRGRLWSFLLRKESPSPAQQFLQLSCQSYLMLPPHSIHSPPPPPRGLRENSSGSANEAWGSHLLFWTLFLLFLHSLLCSESDFPESTPSLIVFQPLLPSSHTSRNLPSLYEAFPNCLGAECLSLLESHQSGFSTTHYFLPNKNDNGNDNSNS